jgi:hypothetical protein
MPCNNLNSPVTRKGCWEVVSVVTCEQGDGQLGLGLNSRQ